MTPEFSGNIKDGKLTLTDIKAFKRWIQTLKGKVFVSVKKKRKQRSNPQNRYLWGCIYKLVSDHTGYTAEECHQIFTEKFISYEKNGRQFVRSTTKLTTKEFEEYAEKIRRLASMELQLYIPEPNEPNYFYYEKETP